MTPAQKEAFKKIWSEVDAQRHKIESEIYEYRRLLGKLEAVLRTDEDEPTEASAHVSYVHHLVLNALNPTFNVIGEGTVIAYRRALSS